MASSVAAACNSKLNERQNRFRSASPQARLTRIPKGDKLHSAGLIEEAFDDELLLGRDDAERFVPRGKIAGQLARASFRQTREIQWPLVQTRFVAFGVGRRKLLPFPLTPALSLGEREH